MGVDSEQDGEDGYHWEGALGVGAPLAIANKEQTVGARAHEMHGRNGGGAKNVHLPLDSNEGIKVVRGSRLSYSFPKIKHSTCS